MERRKEQKGTFYVLLAGTCWGIIGLFTRYLSSIGITPVQETFIRNAVAAAAMAAVIGITDRRRFRIHLRDLWMFLGTGIGSIVFFNICYFRAMEVTTMSVAAVLLYTAPCFVMVMSCCFFGEKLTGRKITALALAFAGCILTTGVIRGGAKLSPEGILLGLGAGFGYALYSIFGTLALRKYDSVTVTFYTFFIAACALLPFAGIGRLAEAGAENQRFWLYGLLLGILSTLLPFLMYTKGLSCLDAGKASIMAFVEPLVATVCGILAFGEKITAAGSCGMMLIFLSVVLLNIHTKRAG